MGGRKVLQFTVSDKVFLLQYNMACHLVSQDVRGRNIVAPDSGQIARQSEYVEKFR